MKILNFGSLNTDLVFSVPHFVRAGETLAADRTERFCGGKGLNQSVALARAGAEVYHAGCVGEDGGPLLKMLEQSGADCSLVEQREGLGGMAVIQVDEHGQNCILLYGGSNQAVTSRQIDRTLARFESGDLLLLQNEINGLAEIIEKAWKKGMRIALNPSPIGPQLKEIDLSKLSWLILNEIEGAELSGCQTPDEIIRQLHRMYPSCAVVLTLGQDGAIYSDRQTTERHGIYRVPVVDTTAAGDTFTGFFLASVMGGKTPREALETASKASALAVSKKGAAPSVPTMEQVKASRLELA